MLSPVNSPTDRRLFLREFLRDPLRTASVTPSGVALARQMVLPVPLRGQPVVVELGPGTGPMTHAIRQRLAGRGRHLAVELNPRMARLLAGRCPDVEVVEGDACELPGILADRAGRSGPGLLPPAPEGPEWPGQRRRSQRPPQPTSSIRDERLRRRGQPVLERLIRWSFQRPGHPCSVSFGRRVRLVGQGPWLGGGWTRSGPPVCGVGT